MGWIDGYRSTPFFVHAQGAFIPGMPMRVDRLCHCILIYIGIKVLDAGMATARSHSGMGHEHVFWKAHIMGAPNRALSVCRSRTLDERINAALR